MAGANQAAEPHWLYFPEATPAFYRAGSPSAAVAGLAPPSHRSYYVEVSHPRGTACPVGSEEILRGMRAVGLLVAGEEPLVCARSTIDCAYVLMDHDHAPARERVLDWLARQRILSTGRYGAWTYASMEDAMILGRDAAGQARELTWQA